MKISILHPSRGRSEQAFLAMCNFTDMMSHTIDYEYILSVDTDDKSPYTFIDVGFGERYKKIINDNHNVVQAANAAAEIATGDILILISDDFTAHRHWDITITQALEGKSGILKTYDGVQRWIVTLPIMTGDYYDEQGHIYYPKFEHMFCDTDQTHKADLEKKLIIRNDIVFLHHHYSTEGGWPKDAISRKADLTWKQGEAVYLQRCMNRFGLGDIDIYDLSPEAKKAGHVAWLKKKLR